MITRRTRRRDARWVSAALSLPRQRRALNEPLASSSGELAPHNTPLLPSERRNSILIER